MKLGILMQNNMLIAVT